MPGPYHPQQNHLLAALPPAERERLYPHLELVAIRLGRVLYESGDTLLHVYFPLDSIVSLLYVMEKAHRQRSRSWATRGSSASLSSWAVKPHRAGRSCRALDTLIGWLAGGGRMSSIVTG